MDKQFLTALHSLRPIAPSEAGITPLRVRIQRAKGDGILAPGAAFGEYPPERGELLNQLYPHGRVIAGQPIKTVR
jgi:predicted Zn-dependent protease